MMLREYTEICKEFSMYTRKWASLLSDHEYVALTDQEGQIWREFDRQQMRELKNNDIEYLDISWAFHKDNFVIERDSREHYIKAVNKRGVIWGLKEFDGADDFRFEWSKGDNSGAITGYAEYQEQYGYSVLMKHYAEMLEHSQQKDKMCTLTDIEIKQMSRDLSIYFDFEPARANKQMKADIRKDKER